MNEQPSQTPVVPNQSENYPVQMQIEYPAQSSRLLALITILFFIKAVLLIPHLIVMYFLSLFALIGMAVAQLIVLVKGVYPPKLFALQKAVYVWQMRVNAYMIGLTDKYPPLTFDSVDRPNAMSAIKQILVGLVIFAVIITVLILITNN